MIDVQIKQFEGPLSLLLFLIRKQEMDIFDININEITKQYLDYIKRMQQFDLELAGDFVAMAATLLQIKSRMLLPQYDENGDEVEVEDPRKELVHKLLEYQKFQELSQKIYSRPLLGRDVWKRISQDSITVYSEEEIVLDEGGLFSMISLYRKAIRGMKKTVHRIAEKAQSIASRILEIRDKLIPGTTVLLRELLTDSERYRKQLLITFLSVLELGKMGFISVFQNDVYGDIHITAKKEIDREIASNVEEYDAAAADNIAAKLFEKAEAFNIEDDLEDESNSSTQLSLLNIKSQEEPLLQEEDMASDEEIARAEEELLSDENPQEILQDFHVAESLADQNIDELINDDEGEV